MDVNFIFCYTQYADNVSYLKESLKKHYPPHTNVHITQNRNSFYYDLNRYDKSPDLIILEFTNETDDHVEMIKLANVKAPLTAKLIISDIENLLTVERQISDKEHIQFLKRPYSSEDIELALAQTKRQKYLVHEAQNISNFKRLLEQVEEEVAVRFHKLVDANTAKEKIISIISHDLKSPFLGLIGLTDMLLSEWDNMTDSDKIELISDLKNTSLETLKLLEDLLDWAKGQKEKLEISIEEIKVRNLVDTSIKVSEKCAIPKGVKVHNKIKNDLKINADEHLIAVVFRNLISNAVKFTKPGGKVQITAKENKDSLTFCVADNGIGIEKTQILDLFHKENGKQQKSVNGKTIHKGLGLLLCKDFVERSGGKIWLETQKGIGSKFYFTLPG